MKLFLTFILLIVITVVQGKGDSSLKLLIINNSERPITCSIYEGENIKKLYRQIPAEKTEYTIHARSTWKNCVPHSIVVALESLEPASSITYLLSERIREMTIICKERYNSHSGAIEGILFKTKSKSYS